MQENPKHHADETAVKRVRLDREKAIADVAVVVTGALITGVTP